MTAKLTFMDKTTKPKKYKLVTLFNVVDEVLLKENCYLLLYVTTDY